MKPGKLAGVLEWGLVAVLVGVVVHAPVSVGLGALWPDAATGIKAWKEILLAALSAAAIILVMRAGAWRGLLGDRVVQVALGFIGLHLLLAVFGDDIRSVVAGLMIDLRFVVAFLLAYVAVRLRPTASKNMTGAAAAGAVIVLGFGLLQITVLPDNVLSGLGYSKQTITPFTTIDSNPDYVRINSTLRGPNPLGALAVVYLALGLAYLARLGTRASVARKSAAVGIVTASLAVLFASYSRSAYVATAAAVATVLLLTVRLSKRAGLVLVAVMVVAGIGLGTVSTTDWFSNVVLHEDPESTTLAKSNDGHISSLKTGIERTIAQPLGGGIGSTGSASLYDADSANDLVIENQYFFVAHESGWLGLALFIGLLVTIMIKLWRGRQNWLALGLFASGIGLAGIGLLLPVWADETVSIIWWTLTGAAIANISGIIEDRYATRARQ